MCAVQVAAYIRENCSGTIASGTGTKAGSSNFSPKIDFKLPAPVGKGKGAGGAGSRKHRPTVDPVLRDIVGGAAQGAAGIVGRPKRARVLKGKFGDATGSANQIEESDDTFLSPWRPTGHEYIGKRVVRKYDNLGGRLVWGLVTKWYATDSTVLRV